MSTNPVDIRSLPMRIRLIAEKVGIQRTYEFLSEHWSTTLYIPATLDNSDLAEKVGEDVALALIELWPSQKLDPPKPDKLMQQWRDHELNAGTLKTKEACERFNITRQRCSQIRQKATDKTSGSQKRPQQLMNLELDLG